MDLKVTQCRGCNADIVWVTTKSGTPQPLDAKPEKRIIIREGKAYVTDTYTPHHATCPKVDQFRKRGEPS